MWEVTVAEHKAANIHVRDGISECEFVKLRTDRDKRLPLPDRMLHALQVICAAAVCLSRNQTGTAT